ncbi:hypothetical protein CORC01_01525 [Colletotrichum orchidophilum]|uniref:Uncharacterized protein n=1 Tax=Colletotrichum orchidophilum TaxID=1209926 RepID=A0A1G4BNW2_9PEZI|nr:hypothetical protein CORC01_01525 [Colletotrichum orchidophilum]
MSNPRISLRSGMTAPRLSSLRHFLEP